MKSAFFALFLAAACSRPVATSAVEPVSLGGGDDAAIGVGADDAVDVQAAADAEVSKDVVANPGAAVTGGLWVMDGNGDPVGIVVSRGHPSLSAAGTIDFLRDGVLLYSPKTGLFFGVQMSTGKIIAPRLGVTDTTCSAIAVAGYYGDGDFISGQNYAFVYLKQWYKISSYKPASFVSCGGTVSDGADPKCAPHAGSCRGFPVETISPALPTLFSAPMAFSWVAK